MLGSPPLPQPLKRSVVGRRRRSAQRMGRMVLVARVFRIFQKQRKAVGSRQRRILSGVLFGERLLLDVVGLGSTEVMVLMVAIAAWGEPLRVMLEGSSEQVAYWPGVIGTQLRTTVPLKLACGVSWRL